MIVCVANAIFVVCCHQNKIGNYFPICNLQVRGGFRIIGWSEKQLPLRTNGYKPRIAFNPLLQTIILFSVGDWCTKYPFNNPGLQLKFCTLQI
ncbi:hypothetical protein T10_1532 [Trichinella papuae]|uniref:Uncharacterized protein n=1 Tax=Trichinella papuae TaxID=268474 RepID=A0A0V1MVM7_9BILA|nr:hypothetical protein T10_1532 [Trichinella papuae]